ncbi:DUF4114 domain-containing protein [Roseateles sp. SL47]|uniref:DUF4114 domain-containing protein n=1 Tax=Roseateles sp. SL47 TaxID=2995138 RepID=UPI00226ED12B|nr:DUF4114 domain-containing protein [Roseateles sp. SL47]WAC75286.1 DUF4114 domain-containing protein [Roseateles sp. SL47]
MGMGFPGMGFSGGFPGGFGAGLASGWMRQVAHGMSGGWGGMGPWCGHGGGYGVHGHHGGPGSWGGEVPREGQWNAEKGGYTIGRSGRLEMTVGQAHADYKNQMQFRVNGGEWQTLSNSKDTGHTATIHAPPGSNVQFRIQTPEGNTLRAGTTRNVDGRDYGQVTKTDKGYRLGFEDQPNGADRDFNDAVLNLRDPGRRWAW